MLIFRKIKEALSKSVDVGARNVTADTTEKNDLTLNSKPVQTATILPFPDLAKPEPAELLGSQAAMKQTEGHPRFRGLPNTPELKEFFDQNFFGLGCHNGAHFRTREALDQGKQTIISRFERAARNVIERRREKVDHIRLESLRIEGISATTTAQLGLAAQQLEHDIAILNAQVAEAANGCGWVRVALDLYQTGYLKGMQDAIDFSILAKS